METSSRLSKNEEILKGVYSYLVKIISIRSWVIVQYIIILMCLLGQYSMYCLAYRILEIVGYVSIGQGDRLTRGDWKPLRERTEALSARYT